MTKPIYRLPKAERRSALAPFVGRAVVVYEDIHRDGERIARHVCDELVGVAYPRTGTISDQAIVRLREGWTMDDLDLVAISVASIAGVRRIADGLTAGICTDPTEED